MVRRKSSALLCWTVALFLPMPMLLSRDRAMALFLRDHYYCGSKRRHRDSYYYFTTDKVPLFGSHKRESNKYAARRPHRKRTSVVLGSQNNDDDTHQPKTPKNNNTWNPLQLAARTIIAMTKGVESMERSLQKEQLNHLEKHQSRLSAKLARFMQGTIIENEDNTNDRTVDTKRANGKEARKQQSPHPLQVAVIADQDNMMVSATGESCNQNNSNKSTIEPQQENSSSSSSSSNENQNNMDAKDTAGAPACSEPNKENSNDTNDNNNNDNIQVNDEQENDRTILPEVIQQWGRSPTDAKVIDILQQEVNLYQQQQDMLWIQTQELAVEREALQHQVIDVYNLLQAERERTLELERQLADLLVEQYQILTLWQEQVQVMEREALEQQLVMDEQDNQIRALQERLERMGNIIDIYRNKQQPSDKASLCFVEIKETSTTSSGAANIDPRKNETTILIAA